MPEFKTGTLKHTDWPKRICNSLINLAADNS